jgi:[histone H3]-lysine36 N-trimethyltransferase
MTVETPELVVVKEEISFRRQVALPEVEFSGPKPLGFTRVVSDKPVSTKAKAENEENPAIDQQKKISQTQDSIAAVIAAVKKAAEEGQRAKDEAEAKAAEAEQVKKRKREEREKEKARKKEKLKEKEAHEAEKEVNKEKRLQKLVGAVVVKVMSKYSKELGHDNFKKYAKEVRITLSPV